MVLFDFQHVWYRRGHLAVAVNKNRHIRRYLSQYGVVNSYKTHLRDVALILLYLLKFFPFLCAKYKCVN